MQPLVSIIIPSFNRASLISETMKSIQDQTLDQWECIVVDDGSTDETHAVVGQFIEKDDRIQFHNRPENRAKGANACRNYGFELSRGEFICWIDSDDLMHPQKLEKQTKQLQAQKLNFSICKSLLFKDSINDSQELKSESIKSDNPFEDFFMKKIIIPVQAPLYNKAFLNANNFKYDEELQAGQEWEFIANILANFDHYATIDEPLDYIRKHEQSISGQITHHQKWNYFKARYNIFNKYKRQFSDELKDFTHYLFLNSYKDFLRSGNYRHACYVWRKCLIGDQKTSVTDHLRLGISWMTFFLFKKGDVFLAKVSSFNNNKS
ncbi:MAG: glycosyltransferase family 2 protein [Flavobacteriaceae bacterium]|nr:glycosyltransferase family 2 protein [Flavobacteriaceae bacterium]